MTESLTDQIQIKYAVKYDTHVKITQHCNYY
jgi:hypothetical protein